MPLTYDDLLDLLLPYVEGTMTLEQAAQVEAALKQHPDLAGVVADLRAFPDVAPAPGVEPLSEEELAEKWNSLRDRLVERDILPGRTVN